ncbi:primosomal protein N [Lactobacillus psittaci DSM 15354]|uniref:Replication restart protein PriA n=1 Tax=Lactobacillus psittaci DSM 15354 TaxID=1122152 RepID=A0A0R1SCD9_9LACO|nr:primosomal protein N [Lactobacillus psittaci DSM 15354]
MIFLIAQVIVDVASQQTDHVFEYLIPPELDDVTIGSRVVVPFGRRKVQGFVVNLVNQTNYQGKLKKLLLVVDEQAPLTPELVELSQYLADNIFAYRISILKTMLPRVMRANYRKIVTASSGVDNPLFTNGIFELTGKEDLKIIISLKSLIKAGKAKIEYLVENQAKEKLEKCYNLVFTKEQYQDLTKEIRKNAKQQQILINFILTNFGKFPLRQSILAQAGIKTETLKNFCHKGWLRSKLVETYRNPLREYENQKIKPVNLNDEQAAALKQINQKIEQQEAETFLLEGVTGSGKTEVYLHAISQSLKVGRNALMLVPEISLTPQMVKQVHARFGKEVAVLHSALSEGEKYDEWRRIRRGEAKVVVGARSAIFAPLTNIGIIIIDEEHESSYKQEDTPRYHARDVAIWRSKYHHAPLILGSATPSLDSRARAQKGRYHLLTLKKRANKQALPEVKIIDLRKSEFAGSQFDLTSELVDAIKTRISQQQQVILLLNRRGYANFMLCRDCGFVLECPNCDLSLTMHRDVGQMICHYCGYHEAIPNKCPNCHSKAIRFLGTGTQKVESELNELLPLAKVLRMDVDTTRRKGSYKKILDAFGRHEADILLGTQMIAKGLDFPNVTLVGVINADTGLYLPDYNASEKTFELLTQVSGRAGRAEKKGQVLIQTFNPDHYAIKLAQSQDYEAFYQTEMKIRYQGNYPPFFFTTLISVASKNEQNAAKEAFIIKRQLMHQLHQPTIILGPTPSAISKIKNLYYYQILVKYKHEPKLKAILHQIQDAAQEKKKYGLNIYIDNQPNRIM